jgi:hypothetical protein
MKPGLHHKTYGKSNDKQTTTTKKEAETEGRGTSILIPAFMKTVELREHV